ncbi:MAG: hypothetical protein AUF61_01695 [Chloroflexi bacterium 13_1_20CM_66_33]|nr:MAG: hypothetical protein AUF61_01695 [Chloroflexi bacterium 13_1_20CM_66_33]TME78154.1 MAG: hypothetical protein E6I46_02970 [Chloroflexota bacterium]TMG17445.1 MAG: hypothetical protein E6I01_03900 [Chloroflexota bacterium]TMG17710.1 MAG: hypothetical protein E6H98_06830 [Chloroflexota bacterium]TMG50041.1 MAG: hypothetical protein E6H90_03000 [Chloroflexota bacterium]
MGNVIPWSQIHPSIKSEEPFVAVVIIDPKREICVSEMVPFEPEALANPDQAAPELIAAAQAAAARVASGYRTRRKQAPTVTVSNARPALKRRSRGPTGPPPDGSEILKPPAGRENSAGLRVLTGGIR